MEAIHHHRVSGTAHSLKAVKPGIPPSKRSTKLHSKTADLRERRNQYQQLERVCELLQTGTFQYNATSGQLRCTKHTKNLFGFPRQSKLSLQHLYNCFPEGYQQLRFSNNLQLLISTGTSFEEEFRIITADKCIRWMRIGGFKAAGKNQYTGYLQPVPEKTSVADAVQEVLNEKNRLLERITDGFFTVDLQWNISNWNKAAEEILQLPRQLVLGRNIWDVFEDAVSIRLYSELHRAIAQQRAVQFEEYLSNRNIWLEISASPSDKDLTVFFRNITERHEAEARLNEINHTLAMKARALVASNTELERFAYVASHDLQEPLRMVTSFLQRLEKKCAGQIDEEARQYIQFAVEGANRMRQLILDLLDYSRAGLAAAEQEAIQMQEVMNQVLLVLQEPVQLKQAVITVNPLPTVYGTRTAIIQLMLNLVGNALKYQKPLTPPEITVSAERFFNEWLFCVTDNGIGIDPAYQEKIFQVFQRLHTGPEYDGTGIGLSICKKIIERHGGKIWVESTPDNGSRFYFTLPNPEPSAQPAS